MRILQMNLQSTPRQLSFVSVLGFLLYCMGACATNPVNPIAATQQQPASDIARIPAQENKSPIALPSNSEKQALPLLAMTTVSYHDYDWGEDCLKNVDRIFDEGFRAIAFSSAFAYKSDADFTINDTQVPSIEKTSRCMEEAVNLGMIAMLKPHVDGGWRGGYNFDPSKTNYFEKVILRQLLTISKIKADTHCDKCQYVLFLGTELSYSEQNYPQGWLEILNKTKKYLADNGLTQNVHLTQDFMFDISYAGKKDNRVLGEYIKGLDSVSLSQYTPMDINGRNPDGVAKALKQSELDVRQYLKDIGVPNSDSKMINIGEFAICRNLHEPWAYGADLERKVDDIATGNQGLLKYLRQKAGATNTTMQFSLYWSVGDADLLNPPPGYTRLPVADEIEKFNRDASGLNR